MTNGPSSISTGSIAGYGMAKSGMGRNASAIRVGTGQEVGHVIGDAVLERGKALVIAGGAQTIHPRLGEVLVPVADFHRCVDELVGRLAARRAEGRRGEVGEAARLAGANIEKP